MVTRLLWNGLKLTTVGSLGAATYHLHSNDWDLNNIGVVRFGRAAFAAGVCVIDYKYSLRRLDVGSKEYRQTLSETHLRCAKRLRSMCCKNRGVFIKVGQHLGALDYLLPPEYVHVMKVLHSDAPQSPFCDIKKVIEVDLSHKVRELFLEIDEKPLGTASLAQVYKATLRDGRQVAIKVQHPNVRAHSAVDMATMELLVDIVGRIFPDFNFEWLVELTKKNLPLELDFIHEGKNCEQIAMLFKETAFVKIPQIYWDYTSERVLTMEYCNGHQVNNREFIMENNIDVNEVSYKLGKLYSEMIFVQGFVHCDPHPGNVLVHKDDEGKVQIVLLDHGLYEDLSKLHQQTAILSIQTLFLYFPEVVTLFDKTLSEEFRITYCKLWLALIERDMNGVKKHAQSLGTGELFPLFACMLTARSWKAIDTGITTAGNTETTAEEEDEIRKGIVEYLPAIAQIFNLVPRSMLLIMKTNDLLRGIESQLRTRANASSFITMSKCCISAVYASERKSSGSRLSQLRLTLTEQWKLFNIICYEWLTWIYMKFTQVI